jgi:hypothetical protein
VRRKPYKTFPGHRFLHDLFVEICCQTTDNMSQGESGVNAPGSLLVRFDVGVFTEAGLFCEQRLGGVLAVLRSLLNHSSLLSYQLSVNYEAKLAVTIESVQAARKGFARHWLGAPATPPLENALMKRPLLLLPAALLLGWCSLAQALDCDITRHGAKPGDEVLDTVAIQKAIDRCAAAGGGRVVVPGGKFVSGTIFLKSNIELHLAHGALLMGSPKLTDYAPSQEAGGSHAEGKRDGLIIAVNVKNVSITGFGTVDGNGEKFWDPGFLESGKSRPTLPRPMPWVEFRDSSHITVRDARFQHSPSYGVAFTRSTDVHVLNISIFNDPRSPNTDGIQVNDSQRVNIRGVHIATGDDAIVLKSDTRDVEDVVVSDSVLTSDDTAFKYGTGSTKAIRRVTLRDSTLIDSRLGIGLFMRRGGVYEDLEVRNVRFVGRSRSTMEWPIYIDVDRRSAESGLGSVRDIRIDGMRIESRGNVLIAGNPAGVMENITLRDIEFKVVEPADVSKVRKSRGNVAFGTVEGSVDYATERSHFTFGHVHGLVIEGLRLVGKPADLASRRPITLIDVAGGRIEHVAVGARANSTDPLLQLRDAGDLVIAGARVQGETAEPRVEIVGSTRHGGTTMCRRVVSECAAVTPPAQSAQAAQ